MRRPIVIVKVFFVCFASLILLRTIQLQLNRSPRLARLADRQFKAKLTALPRRGLIFDRSGQGLAISLKVSSLYVRPEVLRNQMPRQKILNLSHALARLLKMPASKIRDKLTSKKSFVWVKRQLNEKEERLVRDLDLESLNDGLALAEETRRYYPNRDLAAHIMGTVNVDSRGIEGLELYYDAILAGESTRIASLKDAMGRSIFRDDKGILAFKDGQSLMLTLDKTVQYETEKILRASLAEHGAKAGTAIVASVKTGEILAMANFPTYDPNFPKQGSQETRRNRAITDIYEPGSTFKPLLVAAALEKGMPPTTKIYCEKGKFTIGGRTISEAETHEKYEWLNFSDILKHSSNIGAAKLALNLGSESVTRVFDNLGIGTKTGVDLPGEVSGLSGPRPEIIKDLQSQVRLANVGFGHGVTVTPLQMLSYYLALANQGTWIQPKLVRAIVDDNGKILHQFNDLKSRRLYSAENAKTVSKMLETVMQEGGTGVQAQLPEWIVAGKTGTAQKVDPVTHKYSHNKYMASFIGFAPARDPQLVALVIIDEPSRKYYAGDTAAPAFREIMRTSLQRMGHPTVNDAVSKMQLANGFSLKAIEQQIHQEKNPKKDSKDGAVNSMDPQPHQQLQAEVNEKSQIKLPNLKGMTIREALRTIPKQNFDVQILGSGILKEQIPNSNEWLEPGSRIKLVFSP